MRKSFTGLFTKNWQFVSVLILGLLVRLLLTRYGNFGDVALFAEWGKRFFDLSRLSYYYDRNWYYSYPDYPPASPLLYAGLYWLYERRYLLAEIHNAIKIIPANFIIYFGKPVPNDPLQFGYGYYLLLKLPPIFADLGISVIIYRLIFRLTRSIKKSFAGMCFYLFNPLTVFLSAVWGQTDQLVALIGIISFVALHSNKAWLSLPLMFISLFIKPNWILILPLYLFYIYILKPKVGNLMSGLLISLVLFLLLVTPFSESDVLGFTKSVLLGSILPVAKGTPKASVSAINFYSIFFSVDKTPAAKEILLLPISYWGYTFYGFLNILSFKYLTNLRKEKLLEGIIISIFIIGLGSFLFLTNMLERYFFAAFPSLVILLAIRPKLTKLLLILNLILLANLVWAFFRRSVGVINHLFSDYNYLLVRILAIVATIAFIRVTRYNLKRGEARISG